MDLTGVQIGSNIKSFIFVFLIQLTTFYR